MVETRSTGRLPNAVCIGTLSRVSTMHKRNLWAAVPDEVTETEHQNTHANELNDAGDVGIERFDEIGKHRRKRQRTEALTEGYCCGHGHGSEFPFLAPVLSGC